MKRLHAALELNQCWQPKSSLTFIGAGFSSVSEAFFVSFPVCGDLNTSNFICNLYKTLKTASSRLPFINDRSTILVYFLSKAVSYKSGWICADLGGEAVWEAFVGSNFASRLKYQSFISVGCSCCTSCRNKNTDTSVEMSEATLIVRHEWFECKSYDRQIVRVFFCTSPVIFEFYKTKKYYFCVQWPTIIFFSRFTVRCVVVLNAAGKLLKNISFFKKNMKKKKEKADFSVLDYLSVPWRHQKSVALLMPWEYRGHL